MGGGSLMTPVLVLVLGFNPTTAIGTDILHGAIFKSVGAARQRTLGNVKARLSGWMFLGSAPMSLAGVALATYLERRYGDGIESVGATVLGWRSSSAVRVPESLLRMMLALVLTLSGLQLVGFPGSSIVVPVLLVLGLGGLAVFAFVTRRPRTEAEPARAAET